MQFSFQIATLWKQHIAVNKLFTNFIAILNMTRTYARCVTKSLLRPLRGNISLFASIWKNAMISLCETFATV